MIYQEISEFYFSLHRQEKGNLVRISGVSSSFSKKVRGAVTIAKFPVQNEVSSFTQSKI